ncbi:MAG TPA: biotin/lipoyl-binding protein, partial [Candidatus Paceibacterota bacterium]|nr:biotin/lipoyl-binding protein [Candidatus Paceibacterota bacterium]
MLTNILNRTKDLAAHLWRWALAHKLLAGLIALVILGGGYYWYQQSAAAGTTVPQYTLSAVDSGTLVVSVSGTGQVSASDQVDVKTQASGNVIAVPVKEGQAVKAGDILVKLDATTAAKALRDAQANLDSAKLALAKLQEPADALSLTQAQNSLAAAQQAKQNATDALSKAYDDGFTSVSNAFLDLPNVMSGLNSVLYGTNFGTTQANIYAYYDMAKNYRSDADQFETAAITSYNAAEAAYTKNLDDFKSATR